MSKFYFLINITNLIINPYTLHQDFNLDKNDKLYILQI